VSDESSENGHLSPETLGGCTVRLLLVVDDPDATVARSIPLGATLVSPVEERHRWLLGRIEDPFGHHWEIGRPLAEWPPALTQ
jgi:PhnB protein